MCFWAQMPKYGNLGPDPPKIKIFEKFSFQVKRLKITLPTSTQPLSGDNFSSRNQPNRVFGPNAQIW